MLFPALLTTRSLPNAPERYSSLVMNKKAVAPIFPQVVAFQFLMSTEICKANDVVGSPEVAYIGDGTRNQEVPHNDGFRGEVKQANANHASQSVHVPQLQGQDLRGRR